MIDFGDFIESQRGNVGFPRRKKKKKIDEISNHSVSIEEAKEKVHAIIEKGKKRRRKKKSIENYKKQ
ncbi:MAG: hypothetical protein J6U54_20450 [Clostridiales bacterium]|nr:hypothetical protein [Clostridiales bacterium]